MTFRPLTEHHLEFLSLKGGCTGSSGVNIRQNATLLDIKCHSSIISIIVGFNILTFVMNICIKPFDVDILVSKINANIQKHYKT